MYTLNMSTRTNDHTLVKAGDNRRRRLQSMTWTLCHPLTGIGGFRLLPWLLTAADPRYMPRTIPTRRLEYACLELSSHRSASPTRQQPDYQ